MRKPVTAKPARVSIAMCTYNGARFLPQQLESIAAQTQCPDELIVCDDGSTDYTLEVLRDFRMGARFPVHIFENADALLGSTKNFEKAVRFCEGSVIFLADQDDIWQPEKIEVFCATLENHPEAGYVFSDLDLIDEFGAPKEKTMWESLHLSDAALRRFSGANQFRFLLRRTVATGAAMAFRASLADSLLPFSRYLVHDYWISLVASCLGARGRAISEPLVQYRQHAAQQIGAPPPGASFLRKIDRARKTDAAQYLSRALGLQELKQRILAAGANGQTFLADDLNLLDQNLEHFFRRAAAHSLHGTARIGKVVSEAATGRYRKFSNSWQSIVEDLCF